jgi:hypothetical protein
MKKNFNNIPTIDYTTPDHAHQLHSPAKTHSHSIATINNQIDHAPSPRHTPSYTSSNVVFTTLIDTHAPFNDRQRGNKPHQSDINHPIASIAYWQTDSDY